MPCSDSAAYDRIMQEAARKKTNDEIKTLKTRNDKLARLLCEAMNSVEHKIDIACSSNELRHWWKEHKSWDKQRSEKKEK